MPNNGHQPKISSGAGFMLITFGALVDATQFFLQLLVVGTVLNPFVSLIALIIEWIWLQHLGVSLFTGRRGWAGWSTTIAELFPVLDSVPAWTALNTYIVISDKTGVS